MPPTMKNKPKKPKKSAHVYNTTKIELGASFNESDSFADCDKFTTDMRNITLHDNFLSVDETELLSQSVVGESGNIDLDNAEQIRLVMEMFNVNEVLLSLFHYIKITNNFRRLPMKPRLVARMEPRLVVNS